MNFKKSSAFFRLAFFGLAVSLSFASFLRAEVVERIIAIVNDEIITQSDIAKYADRLKSGGLTDDLLVPDETTKQELIQDREKLLQKMIDEKVIDSEVKRQNLTVPIERVEQEVRSIAKRNGVGREELKAALQERGIPFSSYQDFIKTGLERQSLIEKAITQKIKISEDDVLAAFSSQKGGQVEQAFEYTIAHVYFSNEKTGGPAAAKVRAEKAYKRLKTGESFDRVAAEMTEDSNFEPGGALGVFKTGELQKDLDQSLRRLASGEFTEVRPTGGGFQIVKLNKKRLIPDPRTEKEREKIRAQLYEKAYKRQFQSWLEQLRQDAFVRINK